MLGEFGETLIVDWDLAKAMGRIACRGEEDGLLAPAPVPLALPP